MLVVSGWRKNDHVKFSIATKPPPPPPLLVEQSLLFILLNSNLNVLLLINVLLFSPNIFSKYILIV